MIHILARKGKTMDHSAEAEIKRAAKAAIEQGILNIQPGEPFTLDLSKESIYLHLGHGVNILSMVVQRPLPNDGK